MAVLLRRCIPGILRFDGQLVANRMITTTRTSSPESPWLMMEPMCLQGMTIFNFWCCAKERHYWYSDELKRNRGSSLNFFAHEYPKFAKTVGSSRGWLAYQVRCHLYLVDPTTYRFTQLPPFPRPIYAERVVVLDRRLAKAFVILDGALLFCSPRRRSHDWTPLGGPDAAYESAVYSSMHRRLFCLTYTMKLEAWDVGEGEEGEGEGESPTLDWAVQLENLPDSPSNVRYLAYAEQSGHLFLVVRYFHRMDYCSFYPTVNFEVYKIEIENDKTRLVKMESSLGGMTLFVGMNDPIALTMPTTEVGRLKADAVYFTYDDRIGLTKCIGVFDYKTSLVSPLFSNSLPEYLKLDCPLWFSRRH